MDSKRIDIGVGLALCVLSVVIYWYADQYTGRGVNSYGPNFFPQALSVLLFLASMGLMYQGFRQQMAEALDVDRRGLINAGITLVLAVGYIGLMKLVGFYAASVAFLYITMVVLGQKSLKVRIASSVIVGSIVYAIFFYLLKIPLPEGVLFESVY